VTETEVSAAERAREARAPGDAKERRSLRELLRSAEIDARLTGMLAALALIWIVFQIITPRNLFLTPRNLWNLSVQTSVVAIMATGMVLIIVSRNIDLSVGAVMAVVGMVMGAVQHDFLPDVLRFDHPLTWVIALAIGLVLGAAIGAFQGVIVAYVGVPSFIVTLGGFLVWRGLAWRVASGQTIAPMDTNFRQLGGGSTGTIGGTWSWVVGIAACLGIVALQLMKRRQRARYGFHLRPVWAEAAIAVVGCGAVLMAIWYLNRYYLPAGVVEQRGLPPGTNVSQGLAIPVLIALGVAVVMTFVATRRRFGRYVYGIGGNPEAAELAGIKTQRTIVKTFALMGLLVGLAAAVQIARLNAAVSSLGINMELNVIAAAVIGGTSFTGGVGTIAGAVLGALVMQSLVSGMVLMGIEAPLQDVVVGIVLVLAVTLDTIVRRRAAR
jgi:D-xylose transport system permease protein